MMLINNYSLYRHTSPSGKCYIGITSIDPIKRWGVNGTRYLCITKNGTPKHPAFYNAIIKYGWDNIKHEVLFKYLSKERACKLEQELIKHYKGLNLSYNTTDGGEGIWGYKFTPEQITRLSESHKGIKQSEETIAKRVKSNTGKRRSDEQKMKRSKPVVQCTKDGQFIAEYFGVREAERRTGIKGCHIGQCCDNSSNRKTAGGFIWRWKLFNNMITEFKLQKEEAKRAEAFEERHRHKDVNKGAIGGHINYIFTPTSIGTGVSMHCNICGVEENITEYNW